VAEMCSSCKHWRGPTEPRGDDYDDEIRDRFGRCDRVPHYPGHDPLLIADEVAFVQDASGYSANLYTLAEFGCTLHEVTNA
jgi:hypothetical protein